MCKKKFVTGFFGGVGLRDQFACGSSRKTKELLQWLRKFVISSCWEFSHSGSKDDRSRKYDVMNRRARLVFQRGSFSWNWKIRLHYRISNINSIFNIQTPIKLVPPNLVLKRCFNLRINCWFKLNHLFVA